LEQGPEQVLKLTEHVNDLTSPKECLKLLGLDTHPDVLGLKTVTHKQANNVIYHMSLESQYRDVSTVKKALAKSAAQTQEIKHQNQQSFMLNKVRHKVFGVKHVFRFVWGVFVIIIV
jgi:wyosine [tRNA(Phe)-imidazoG37] synthetase (radical SAM superfamily)